MTVGLLYVGFLVLGVSYALLAGAFGWFADLGGGDLHADAAGHVDMGHAHPLSGTVLATFAAGFGGGGVVAHYLLEWTLLPGLALATLAGVGLGAAAFGVLELIFRQTQGGAEFSMDEIAGRDGQVITAIPAAGTGEVAYVVRGQREVSPARSSGGVAIAHGQPVVIEAVVGNTVLVRPR